MPLVGSRAVLYRGGTSKALVMHTDDLPSHTPDELKQWLLAAYGSPDARQIDGVGGADILTSKFAHAARSSRPDADLDYTFIQVAVTQPEVSYEILCGNISSSIAPWAIEEGLVEAKEPQTFVRIFNSNINRVYTATVQVENGKPKSHGDTHIDGVPGTAAPISLDFSQTVGGRTGKLLPTGHVIDSLDVAGVGKIDYSLVDIAGVQAFFKASDFGLTGLEDPVQLEHMSDKLDNVEKARGMIAAQLGFAKSPESAAKDSPLSPFSVLIGVAGDWSAYGSGQKQSADSCDFVARVTVSRTVHKAFPVTGAIPTAVCALIKGSTVNQLSRERQGDLVRIGHPSGVISVNAKVKQDGNSVDVQEATVIRTARRIMEGVVLVNTERVQWLSQEPNPKPTASGSPSDGQSNARKEAFVAS